MTDSLADHLREHSRDHYERLEVAEFWSSVHRIAAEVRAWDPARRAAARIAVVGTEDPERVYQSWLAERHGS